MHFVKLINSLYYYDYIKMFIEKSYTIITFLFLWVSPQPPPPPPARLCNPGVYNYFLAFHSFPFFICSLWSLCFSQILIVANISSQPLFPWSWSPLLPFSNLNHWNLSMLHNCQPGSSILYFFWVRFTVSLYFLVYFLLLQKTHFK